MSRSNNQVHFDEINESVTEKKIKNHVCSLFSVYSELSNYAYRYQSINQSINHLFVSDQWSISKNIER